MIGTILFDLDGVLVDTEQYHRQALLQASREILSDVPERMYTSLGRFTGQSTTQKLQYMMSSVADLIDARKQELVLPLLNRIQPDLYRIGLMKALRLENFQIGLVTNTRRSNMHAIIRQMGLWDIFDATIAGDDGYHRKPNPDMYTEAMSSLGVLLPSDSLIVEDSEAGRVAARASGAYVYEVTDANDLKLEELLAGIDEANNCSADGRTGITVRRARLRTD